MNLNKKMFSAALMVIGSGAAFSAGFGDGKITLIGGDSSSVYFGINPPPINKASCSNNADYQFVLDPTTDGGRALYSALLTAKTTNKNVRVHGTGSCILGQAMEGVSYWILYE